MKTEDFRPIKNYENYMININGEVISNHSGMWKNIKPSIRKNGLYIALMNEFGKKVFLLSKIVLETFIGNSLGKGVFYKDRNVYNICLSNLDWISQTDLIKFLEKNENVPEFDLNEENLSYCDIPNFVGYKISSDGKVFSCRRKGSKNVKLFGKWYELKPNKSKKDGRYVVALNSENKVYYKYIHQLVLISFIGPRPDDMEACHNDGVCTNNNLSNLRWDTKENNNLDKIKHGSAPHGERNILSRLTDSEAKEIKELIKSGLSILDISKIFKVNVQTIRRIKDGKSWIKIDNIDKNKVRKHDIINRSGENNKNAKLTEEQVKEIRYKSKLGYKTGQLVKEYGISRGQIKSIKNNTSWTNIGDNNE